MTDQKAVEADLDKKIAAVANVTEFAKGANPMRLFNCSVTPENLEVCKKSFIVLDEAVANLHGSRFDHAKLSKAAENLMQLLNSFTESD